MDKSKKLRNLNCIDNMSLVIYQYILSLAIFLCFYPFWKTFKISRWSTTSRLKLNFYEIQVQKWTIIISQKILKKILWTQQKINITNYETKLKLYTIHCTINFYLELFAEENSLLATFSQHQRASETQT